MRLEKNVGFLKEDKSFDTVISVRPVYSGSNPNKPAGEYGHPVHIPVIAGDGPQGFIEAGLANGTLAEGFPLRTTLDDGSSVNVGTIEIQLTMTKKEGNKAEVKVLKKVLENVSNLPLPATPYTEGFRRLSSTVNGFLNSLDDGPKRTEPIRTGTITIPFSPQGEGTDCQGPIMNSSLSGGFMVVMEPQVIETNDLGEGYVPTSELSSYCFKINNGQTFIPRFSARSKDPNCSAEYAAMTTLANPYIGFVMLPTDSEQKILSVLERAAAGEILDLSPSNTLTLKVEDEGIGGLVRSAPDVFELLNKNLVLCEELQISDAQCLGIVANLE